MIRQLLHIRAFALRPRFTLALLATSPLALGAAVDYEILEHVSIYEKRDAYCAWPAIARTPEGDVVVTYTRSEEHLGPDGQILLSRSSDNGRTWQPPVVVYDTPLDDRESGLTTLADGRLLMHLRTTQWRPTNYANLPPLAYEQATLNRWITHVDTPEYRAAAGFEGEWHTVSEDGGHTWSHAVPGHDSIHGGVHLQNGEILIAAYRPHPDQVGVYVGTHPMGRFEQTALLDAPTPDRLRFGEPHVLQLRSGRVLMAIRATSRPYDDKSPLSYVYLTHSDDHGRTWAEAQKLPFWGFPPHLLQLSDGRVVLTYGHRRAPYGQRAAISDDGVTWKLENEIILRDDAPNKDLGYPVSIELEPGRILTVYYQPNVPADANPRMQPPDPDRVKPGILGTIWQLK
ncbi:MAG: sialidase family protein [Verrucomicrobiota bacterium]